MPHTWSGRAEALHPVLASDQQELLSTPASEQCWWLRQQAPLLSEGQPPSWGPLWQGPAEVSQWRPKATAAQEGGGVP